MRKLLVILLCMMIALAAAGCAGGEPVVSESAATASPAPTPAIAPLDLTISCSGTYAGTVTVEAIKTGINDLKTWSNGQINAVLNEGSADSDAKIIGNVKIDKVSIYFGPASMAAAVIPQLAVCSIPMMFSGKETCNAMLSGSFIDMMQPYFFSQGLQLKGAYCTSFRNLTSSRPISAAEDLSGLRIRTENDQYSELFWKTAGCNFTPLASTNLYIALKKGLIEAQESADSDINGSKLYEAQKFLIKTQHLPAVGIIAMNKAEYDAMSVEHKALLTRFIKQVMQDTEAAYSDEEAMLEKKFSENGMAVSDPSPEVEAALAAAVQPVIDLMKNSVDPALVDQYLAACKKY